MPVTEIQEERRLLVERSAHVALELLGEERRLGRRKRIAGVKRAAIGLVKDRAMQFIGAGFGKDLDTAETNAIELRREGIGVHADLADGILGRQLAVAEAVHENLP